eukprot:8849407-Ditylum_brightwellii.AAC.1
MHVVPGIQNHWPKELWQDPDPRGEGGHQAMEQCTPGHGRCLEGSVLAQKMQEVLRCSSADDDRG